MTDGNESQHDKSSPNYVRVRVHLEPDEEGWPPVSSEGLWSQRLENGNFRLANTPFFAFGLSIGDEVTAKESIDGRLWVGERIRWGGRLTVRIIAKDETDTNALILSEFAPYGVTGEGSDWPRVVTLDIGPESDFPRTKALLDLGESSGRWGYEEANVTDEWTWL